MSEEDRDYSLNSELITRDSEVDIDDSAQAINLKSGKNNHLFNAVQHASTTTLINDWYESYEQNKRQSIKDLINFVLHSAGSTPINEEAIDDSELITEALELLSFKPLSINMKFKKSFAEFWRKFGANKAIVASDDNLIDTLVQWLVAMSSSSFKPLRLVSTIASLSLMTGMVILSSVRNVSHRERLEESRDTIHTAVFAHRFRDTDATIRGIAIQELGTWCLKYPSVYLDTKYLRYLGWMLYDSNHSVRLLTLQAMNRLLKPQLANSLRSFGERFKDRLIKMALNESDVHVRHESIKVIVSMNKLGFIEEVDFEQVSLIIACTDLKSRELIAPLVVEHINDLIDTMITKFDNDGKLFSEVVIGLRAICSFLIDLSVKVDESGKNYQKNQRRIAFDDFSPVGFKIRDAIDGSQSDQLNNLQAWVRRDRKFEAVTVYGFELIYKVISTLLPHSLNLNVFQKTNQNFESMTEYLLVESNEHNKLSEDEENCLVYVLVASIYATTNESSKPDEQSILQAQTCLVEFIPKLIKKYGREYSGNGYHCLTEFIISLRQLDHQHFDLLKKSHIFEEIIDSLIEILNDHNSSIVLEEVGCTLAFLSGRLKGQYSVGTLYENAKARITDLLGTLYKEVGDSYTALMQSIANGLDIDQYTILITTFHKIYSIQKHSPVFDDRFSLMNNCLELTLRAMKDCMSDHITSTNALYYITKLMAIDFLADLSDIADGRVNIDVEATAAKQRSLIDFCEAVVCDNEGEYFGIKFDYLQKCMCLEVVVDVVPICSASIFNPYPVLKCEFSQGTQQYAPKIMAGLCDLALDIKIGDFSIFIDALYTRMQLMVDLKLFPIGSMGPLIAYKFDYWPQCVRNSNQDAEYECIDLIWPEISNNLIGNVGKFALNVQEIFDSANEQELKLKAVEELFISLCKFMTCGIESVLLINKSIEMYLNRRGSLEDAYTLVKEVVAHFKSWEALSTSNFMKHNNQSGRTTTFLNNVHDIISKNILSSLRDSLILQSARVQAWSEVSEKMGQFDVTMDGEARVDLIETFKGRELLQEAKDVNECWAVWAIYSSAVSSIISTLTTEHDFNAIITEIEDAVNNDGDMEGWGRFHECLNAVRRGGKTVTKKAGRKYIQKKDKIKKTSRLSSPVSSPVRRTSRRLSKKIIKAPITESDEDDFDNDDRDSDGNRSSAEDGDDVVGDEEYGEQRLDLVGRIAVAKEEVDIASPTPSSPSASVKHSLSDDDEDVQFQSSPEMGVSKRQKL